MSGRPGFGDPTGLFKPISVGSMVVIKVGARKGQRAQLSAILTPSDWAEFITGMCRVELLVDGSRIDYCRHEIKRAVKP